MSILTIIHEATDQEPFFIIDKPRGLPSAPLREDDDSAVSRLINIYPYLKNIKGKKDIEFGLIHRIDTDTRGLLLVASTQSFFDYICKEQAENRFTKKYKAICDQCPPDVTFPPACYCKNENGKINLILKSRFRPYGLHRSEVRPVTENSTTAAKKKSGNTDYETKIEIQKISGNIIAQCSIQRGYRHQVRCHLAWLGFPVKGDPIYNKTKNNDFCFYATGLSFFLPNSSKLYSIEIDI